MLKIGKTYYLKTWEELKKASNGEFLGSLDFGYLLFLPKMKVLCGDKIRIIEKDFFHEGVYQGESINTSEIFFFTEDMLVISDLKRMIEVRNESRKEV